MADKDFKNNKIAGDYNHIDSVAEKTGNASNTALDSSAENNKKKEDLIKMIESVPYDYVTNATVNFENFEVHENTDEFRFNIE